MSENICYNHLHPKYSAAQKLPWVMILNALLEAELELSWGGVLGPGSLVSSLNVQKFRFIATRVLLHAAAWRGNLRGNITAALILQR